MPARCSLPADPLPNFTPASWTLPLLTPREAASTVAGTCSDSGRCSGSEVLSVIAARGAAGISIDPLFSSARKGTRAVSASSSYFLFSINNSRESGSAVFPGTLTFRNRILLPSVFPTSEPSAELIDRDSTGVSTEFSGTRHASSVRIECK